MRPETFPVFSADYLKHLETRSYVCVCVCVCVCVYTGCNRRNGPNFGRVMLNYNEKKPKTPMSKV